MNVVIRADASTRVGAGHVMRCLTLAGALRERGAAVLFVCREAPGDLSHLIDEAGHEVRKLPVSESERAQWQEDSAQTRAAIARPGVKPDWLIVDHYDLGQEWESALRGSVTHIMAIDDLANRPHDCDVLLDQNFEHPGQRRYLQLLPAGARMLLGSRYALVRPEFALRRAGALARRDGQIRRVLVSMGGADPENDTAKVLQGLMQGSRVPIDVVIGQSNPWQDGIRELCARMPLTELHVQTPHMAELMARADVAITGGGSTTWERCVLGLPGLVAIQSDDQVAIAEAVERAGGQIVLGRSGDLSPEDYLRGVRGLSPEVLARMSKISATLCEGRGTEQVAAQLIDWNLQNDNA